MKKVLLVLLLLLFFCTTACSQSISGRYNADNENSIIQYLEFSGSNVRMGMEFLGYSSRISATYRIERNVVIISSSDGTMELEIKDNNTLIGIGIPIDNVVFIKAGSTQNQSNSSQNVQPRYDNENDFEVRTFVSSGTVVITKYIGRNTRIRIPPTINGFPVVGIDSEAFSYQELTEVVLPDSITRIGDFAFNGNRLTSIVIPGGVLSIGESAFANNRLTRITIPNSVEYIGDAAFRENFITSVTIGANVELGRSEIIAHYWRFNNHYIDNDRRAGTYTAP